MLYPLRTTFYSTVTLLTMNSIYHPLPPFLVGAVRTPRKDYFAVSTSSQTQIERGLAGSSQLCQSRLGTG